MIKSKTASTRKKKQENSQKKEHTDDTKSPYKQEDSARECFQCPRVDGVVHSWGRQMTDGVHDGHTWKDGACKTTNISELH